MRATFGNQEERNALEVRRVVPAEVVDRLLEVVHRAEVAAAQHEDERAEHRQIVLLHERDIRMEVVREHVDDPARTDPDSVELAISIAFPSR